jgi:xanthine/CO dehydrogenase XdhC/CoxF family maturation factor
MSLHEFFEARRARGEPLVLALVVETAGSTYRKPGAQMLIAQDGAAAGLLSGGCLEPDLMARAQRVFESGVPVFAEYDMRTSDDLIWGMGLGCEGAMRIMLTRLDATNDYQPFSFLTACVRNRAAGTYAIATADSSSYPLGTVWLSSETDLPVEMASVLRADTSAPHLHRLPQGECFVAPIALPLNLLLLGAGPDAAPLVEIAALLEWQVTLVDHRPAYAARERFPQATAVVLSPAAELAAAVDLSRYSAAVIMSHNLHADQAYLHVLAQSSIPYIGLLGPAPRRVRLLSQFEGDHTSLIHRLYGPVGLDIAAATPAEIALSIASEIKAVLAGREGGSFSKTEKWGSGSAD